MPPKKPIAKPPVNLRQRRRTDGTWRIWWEADTAMQDLGFTSTDLDPDRPTWSVRQAEALNAELGRARRGEGRKIKTGGRTIAALIHEYRGSRGFKNLRPATQRDYSYRLKTIDLKWGGQAVAGFDKPTMSAWYDTLYDNSGPYQALQMLRMMSTLFAFAETKLGWRAEGSNPCLRLKMSVPPARERWATWAEYDALLAAADTLGRFSLGCAIALAALHGMRQTDVRLARVDGFSDQNGTLVWAFKRSKRGNAGQVAIHRDAASRVHDALAVAGAGQDFLLHDETTGALPSDDLFGKRWAQVRDHAAKTMPSLEDLQFRDLRRTFGVWARMGGASMEDVGDVLGNSAAHNPQLAATYMPSQMNTRNRAVDAVQRPKIRKVE